MNIQPDPIRRRSTEIQPISLCRLPKKDYWSTPFAETLLSKLALLPGSTLLDIACGSGIPTFYLANVIGPTGRVIGLDINEAQLSRARTFQGSHFPWLEFRQGDIRKPPANLGTFDRITGNLSFMFFRPHRKEALRQLIKFLKPGGQLVLTFPSLGTFESLWEHVDQEMVNHELNLERQALTAYRNERPSANDAEQWLKEIGLVNVDVEEYPLEIETAPGQAFLYHPLLRGGFLDDIYECFRDQESAERFMNTIANNIQHFTPLIAQRCVMSGWKTIM
ncbi:MAG: class I SAM-dependent methyltransferase [Nitrospirales bacterium]